MDTDLKDALDEVLDGDAPIPGEEDAANTDGDTSALGAVEPPGGEDGAGATKEPELSVDEQLKLLRADLENERKQRVGITKALTAERGKRQETEGRFTQLSQIVSSVIAKRDEAGKGGDGEQKAPAKEPFRIKGEVSDDGEVFVPMGDVEAMIEAKVKAAEDKLAADLNNLKMTQQQRDNIMAAQQREAGIIQSVIGDDAVRAAAFEMAEKAHGWMVDVMATYARNNGLERIPTAEEALDLLDSAGANVVAAFEKEFPGVDYERVLRMKSSPASLKRAVNAIAAGMAENAEADPDGKVITTKQDKPKGIPASLKKLSMKPPSNASARNEKNTLPMNFAEMVSRIPKDPMDLTDADVAKLREAARLAELGA